MTDTKGQTLEGLAAEMAKQASLGHKRFCVGVHVHEGGGTEEEWIDWPEAFAMLVARSKEGRRARELEDLSSRETKLIRAAYCVAAAHLLGDKDRVAFGADSFVHLAQGVEGVEAVRALSSRFDGWNEAHGPFYM